MTATGLDVFDKSVQTTNIWLQEICEEIGPGKQTTRQAATAQPKRKAARGI